MAWIRAMSAKKKTSPITGHIGTGAINPTTYYCDQDGVHYPATGSTIAVPGLFSMTYTSNQVWNIIAYENATYTDTLGNNVTLTAGIQTTVTINNATDFTIVFA